MKQNIARSCLARHPETGAVCESHHWVDTLDNTHLSVDRDGNFVTWQSRSLVHLPGLGGVPSPSWSEEALGQLFLIYKGLAEESEARMYVQGWVDLWAQIRDDMRYHPYMSSRMPAVPYHQLRDHLAETMELDRARQLALKYAR
jgi:hypothetical protein